MSKAPFRLAFREEGEFVNCYFASTKDMANAMLLSSMRKTIMDHHREVFDAWKLVMTDAFRAMLISVSEKALGKKIDASALEFIEQEAPEGDRKQ